MFYLEVNSDAFEDGHRRSAVLVALLCVDGVVRADAEVTQLHDALLFVKRTHQRQRVLGRVATLVDVSADDGHLRKHGLLLYNDS